MLLNGTGGRQLATRMALNCTANACRSPDVVPATPWAEVRLGAPGVEPEIAEGHAGGAGAGGGGGGGAGVGVGEAVAPEFVDPPEVDPPVDDPPEPDELVPRGRGEFDALAVAPRDSLREVDDPLPAELVAADPTVTPAELSSPSSFPSVFDATRRSTYSTSETVESSAPMMGDELPVAVDAAALPSVPGPLMNGRHTTMTAAKAPPANAERIIRASPYRDVRSPPTANHHDRCTLSVSQP